MKINCLLCAILGAALVVFNAGCSTLERLYKPEVTMTPKAVVQIVTNTVYETNLIARVTERTNVVLVTNEISGSISGYMIREPVMTNYIAVMQTNYVPLFFTNWVQVPTTNYVDRPEVEASITAAGSVLNAFLPGVGSLVALLTGCAYHGYRQVKNRQVNEALIQGVETARAVLTTTPQGQELDANLVKWLMSHQQEVGVFATVSGLVTQYSDKPAAKGVASEIVSDIQSQAKGKM